MKKLLTLVCIYSITYCTISAQQVDYSVVTVPEESGTNITQISNTGDYVCMPSVQRNRKGHITWLTNRILDTTIDGNSIAFLSYRNNTTNIFVKNINRQGGAKQRTNRSNILDFSYSPDGKYICFSENTGNSHQIFQTDANEGYVCRQITSNGTQDFSPIYTTDMSMIFFARQELNGLSIWGYNIKDNFLSTYGSGMNPFYLKGKESYVCSRLNNNGLGEIWIVNYKTGIEECILSDPKRSYTTPTVSPDGEWLLLVGDSNIASVGYLNTDIFVCKLDGTRFSQLTYHAADDLSPTWSRDGKHIYFISQRGSATATANVWRMDFNH